MGWLATVKILSGGDLEPITSLRASTYDDVKHSRPKNIDNY